MTRIWEDHIYESGFTVEKGVTGNNYNLGNSIYFKVNEEEYIADFEDLEYKKIVNYSATSYRAS